MRVARDRGGGFGCSYKFTVFGFVSLSPCAFRRLQGRLFGFVT